MAKLLKTAFFVLLLIFVIEVIFLGYSSLSKKSKKITEIVPIPTTSPPKVDNPAIAPEAIKLLQAMTKTPESRLYIDTYIKTELLAIEKSVTYKQKDRPQATQTFPLGLKIKSSLESEGSWIYYSEPLLKKVKVIIREQGVEKAGTINDLKVGDRIEMAEIWDPSTFPITTEGKAEKVISYTIYIEK